MLWRVFLFSLFYNWYYLMVKVKFMETLKILFSHFTNLKIKHFIMNVQFNNLFFIINKIRLDFSFDTQKPNFQIILVYLFCIYIFLFTTWFFLFLLIESGRAAVWKCAEKPQQNPSGFTLKCLKFYSRKSFCFIG